MTTTIPDSTGLFPRYQAQYAAHRIATFPVRITDEKKWPAITNYGKVGLPGSAALASKPTFANTDALGFMTGSRSAVTILDIDSSDEKILSGALDRHGETPLIVRTGSGKFHCYYRHGGERRRIRPWGELPIDLLGVGGFAVAPPSISTKGSYEIISGTLADIERLPIMRGLDDLAAACPPNFEWTKLREHDGRNNHLFKQLAMEAKKMKNADEVLERAATLNNEFVAPLPTDEMTKCAMSVWNMTAAGRNYFGRHCVFFDAADADQMIREDSDLYLLLSLLRANNGSAATFICTNGWIARSLHWGEARAIAAKKKMLEFGYAHAVTAKAPGRAVRYQWGGRNQNEDTLS